MQKRRHKPQNPKPSTPSAPTVKSTPSKSARDEIDPCDARNPSNSGPHDDPPSVPQPAMSNPVIRRVISAVLVVHFLAIWISFTAVIEPSRVQMGLVSFFQPYLQLTHFGADNRPIYLAHGETAEQPHRVEWSEVAEPTEVDWQPMKTNATGGLAAADRLGRFLSTAASLAQRESSSVVADLLMPLVRAEPNMRSIRIVRLPTELTTVVDDAAPPPYVAHVLRSGSEIQLVQVKSARLVTAHAPQAVDDK